MFIGGPPRHVGPDLGEESECVVGSDAIDLREVDAGVLVQWGPQVEAGVRSRAVFVGAAGPAAATPAARSWRRRLDGGIARGELLLIDVEEFEILLEHEDVFGAVVTGEGRDDLGFGPSHRVGR